MKAFEIQDRRKKIIDIIYEQEEVKVKELLSLFKVSDETIRNDLAYLEAQGILKKVYGGAKLISSDHLEPVMDRTSMEYRKKLQISKEALHYIPRSNCSIGLDQGSTIALLANLLKKDTNKTIFTGSLAAIMELIKSKNIIYCFGGKYSDEDMSFQNDLGFEPYPDIHLDICFLGSSGVKNRNGFCTSSFMDAELKRQLLKKSTKKVVLLDSSKFHRTSLIEVAPWSAVDIVITDKAIPAEYLAEMKKQTTIITI